MHILNLIGHRQTSWLMENLGFDISVFLSRPFSNRLRNTTVFTAFSSWMHEYITWPHIVTSALEHPISLDKSVVKLIFPGILSSEWKHLDATACMPFGLLLETWGFLQGQGWSGLYFCQFLLTHWRFFVDRQASAGARSIVGGCKINWDQTTYCKRAGITICHI